jgi:hypothetical protein
VNRLLVRCGAARTRLPEIDSGQHSLAPPARRPVNHKHTYGRKCSQVVLRLASECK